MRQRGRRAHPRPHGDRRRRGDRVPRSGRPAFASTDAARTPDPRARSARGHRRTRCFPPTHPRTASRPRRDRVRGRRTTIATRPIRQPTRPARSRRARADRRVPGARPTGAREQRGPMPGPRTARRHHARPGGRSRSYPWSMPRLRIAAAQIDVVVGDLPGNAQRIIDAYDAAEAAGADLVVFPELTVTGYPPEDLLLRPAFVSQAVETLDKIAARTGRCAAVIGFPEPGRDLYNAAAVCAHGRVHGTYRKQLLPNYAVFDEQRYFVLRTEPPTLFVIAGVNIGVSICEDAWSPSGPILEEAAGGAELVVNLNASPYYAQRWRERETMLATRAADASVPIVYTNLVGGQDELVFDGASVVL